jgi:hypothetical protein
LTALTSNTGSKFDDGNMPANQSITRGGPCLKVGKIVGVAKYSSKIELVKD